MNKRKVTEKLVKIHREYQTAGGYDDAGKVTKSTVPLKDLKGFDSDFIPEIVRRLARELDHPLGKDKKVKNIYVSHDRKQKLSIDKIAERFVERYAPNGKGVSA